MRKDDLTLWLVESIKGTTARWLSSTTSDLTSRRLKWASQCQIKQLHVRQPKRPEQFGTKTKHRLDNTWCKRRAVQSVSRVSTHIGHIYNLSLRQNFGRTGYARSLRSEWKCSCSTSHGDCQSVKLKQTNHMWSWNCLDSRAANRL